MKKLLIASCILIFNTSCAIRKNLETPAPTPANKPAIEDGSGGNDGGVSGSGNSKGVDNSGNVGGTSNGGSVNSHHGNVNNNVCDAPPQETKFCAPDSNGKFDGTTIMIQSGQNSSDHSAWAEGGGCILKSVRETWATFNDLEAMKFKAVASFIYQRSVEPESNDPSITHLYEITYYKQTILGPINWTIDWYHGFDKGTFEAPQRVNINYQRVRGTSNIPIWHGGIVLSRVSNSVTSIAIRNEFKARQSSSANENSARNALSEMIQNARNGAPDWNRLNSGLKDNPKKPDDPLCSTNR